MTAAKLVANWCLIVDTLHARAGCVSGLVSLNKLLWTWIRERASDYLTIHFQVPTVDGCTPSGHRGKPADMPKTTKRKRDTEKDQSRVHKPTEAEAGLVTAVFGDDKLISKAGTELDQFDKDPKAQKKPSDDAAAWHDEDDENVTVNVAGVARLRKLRETEGENTVSASALAARLRKQYVECPSVAYCSRIAGIKN
jgi:hypothetical protein